MISCRVKNTQLRFNEENGYIEELDYKGKNYVFSYISVFEIALRNISAEQQRISVDRFLLKDSKKFENGFECVYKSDILEVCIRAEITDGIEWGIDITNNGNDVIEWVNFPQIVVANDLKDSGGNSKILWGFNEGCLIDDMKRRNSAWGYVEPQYPSEGIMGIYPAIVETQCMAYYNDESGLYFASHDKNDELKGIDFYEYNNGINLQFRHFTGGNFGTNYTMPYPMVMKFFEGDWMEAALIYRNWFEENLSSEFVPIKENRKLPNWYSKSPVVVTYPVRGLFDTDKMDPNKLFPYCNAMKYIEEFEKKFDSKIMVILMHWEGTAPWAPPIVWPPYGGEEELKKFIDALHERGDVFGVYCSGLGWTQKSNLVDYDMSDYFEENNLKEYMCLSPEQELPPSKICTAQRSGYDMCPTQKFTEDIICNQVEKMVKSGIDYIQLLDQNHGGTSYFCYSKNHNHPPVPGRWQVDAVKNILSKAGGYGKNILLGCESAAAQAYIPQLLYSDNRYNLCYLIGQPVPLYAYIYHKYLNNFMGNQVCTHDIFDHKKSPENIFLRTAYSFCAGDMLTVVIDDEGRCIFNWGYHEDGVYPNQDLLAKLIKNLNYWRRGATEKYLHRGAMRRPFEVECDKTKMIGSKGFDHEFDSVLTSAWEADGGSVGQFLVNYADEPKTCKINLPDNEKFSLCKEIGNVEKELSGTCEITIDRLSAILIEKI
ncbi:MAG: hypothetical protein IJT23_09220 [Clostridia bacterium]|nr:hypothetical protein [Clostridia bacterium]